jgi:hypothetical protein
VEELRAYLEQYWEGNLNALREAAEAEEGRLRKRDTA